MLSAYPVCLQAVLPWSSFGSLSIALGQQATLHSCLKQEGTNLALLHSSPTLPMHMVSHLVACSWLQAVGLCISAHNSADSLPNARRHPGKACGSAEAASMVAMVISVRDLHGLFSLCELPLRAASAMMVDSRNQESRAPSSLPGLDPKPSAPAVLWPAGGQASAFHSPVHCAKAGDWPLQQQDPNREMAPNS